MLWWLWGLSWLRGLERPSRTPVFPLRLTNNDTRSPQSHLRLWTSVPSPWQTKVCDVMRVMDKFLWYDLTWMMKTGTARSVVVCVCLCQRPTSDKERCEVLRLLMVDVNNAMSALTDLLWDDVRCKIMFCHICSVFVRMFGYLVFPSWMFVPRIRLLSLQENNNLGLCLSSVSYFFLLYVIISLIVREK